MPATNQTPVTNPISNFLSNIPNTIYKIGGTIIIIILIYGTGMLTMYEINKHNPVKVGEKGPEKHGNIIPSITVRGNKQIPKENQCAKNDIHLQMILKQDILNIYATNGCKWASQDYTISCPPKFSHHSLSIFLPISALWQVGTKQLDGLSGLGIGYQYTSPVFAGLFFVSGGLDVSYQKSFSTRKYEEVTISPRATLHF